MTTQPCICCGRHTGHPDKVCVLCLPLIEQIRSVQSFDQYEVAALNFAIEQAGDHVQRNGFDLSAWDEDKVLGFAREIIDAFGAGMRAEIAKNEVPF